MGFINGRLANVKPCWAESMHSSLHFASEMIIADSSFYQHTEHSNYVWFVQEGNLLTLGSKSWKHSTSPLSKGIGLRMNSRRNTENNILT